MSHEKELVIISKKLGECFELVQAGGGNVSVKIDSEKMLIKSSGFSFSEISISKGISVFNFNEAKKKLLNCNQNLNREEREELSKKICKDSLAADSLKPSIETLVHCLFKKYTIHIHPIWALQILCLKDAEQVLNSKLSECGLKWAFVDYKTPGIDLALELLLSSKNYTEYEVLFLKNHGLIVTAKTKESVFSIIEKLEKKLKPRVSKLEKKQRLMRKNLEQYLDDQLIVYPSVDDFFIKYLKSEPEKFFSGPVVPDDYVYWGRQVLLWDDFKDMSIFLEYIDKYHELPKIILSEKYLYVLGLSVKKAIDTLDVFRAHLLAIKDLNFNEIDFLSDDELFFLANWEAETYRKKV